MSSGGCNSRNRKFVTVRAPVEREGHQYYGCIVGKCETCDSWKLLPGLWHLDTYFPIHCYVCHCEMLLDEVREWIKDNNAGRDGASDVGVEFVQDRYVFCTNCYGKYRKRLRTVIGLELVPL